MQEWSSGGLRRPAVVSLQQEQVKRQEGVQHRQVCTDSVHHSAYIPLQEEGKKGINALNCYSKQCFVQFSNSSRLLKCN